MRKRFKLFGRLFGKALKKKTHEENALDRKYRIQDAAIMAEHIEKKKKANKDM